MRYSAVAISLGVFAIAGCGGGGGDSGGSSITPPPPPAKSISVSCTPSATSLLQGTTYTVTAVASAQNGATISSVIVSVNGSAVGSGAGPSYTTAAIPTPSAGTHSISCSATSPDATVAAGSATVSVSFSAPPIVTSIRNPDTFIDACPTSDSAYGTVRRDFELLSAGIPSAVTVVCTDPYTTTAVITDELLAVQAFRMAYYVNAGSVGKLPWTPFGMYDWMKSQIAGINFNTVEGGNSYCCDVINGKKYLGISRKTASNLLLYRHFEPMVGWLALFAHEVRHVSGPGHVTGCAAWPSPTDPAGCDATYDLSNVGSYGVQYWLFSNWSSGNFNLGIGCLTAARAKSLAEYMASVANIYPRLFVTGAPLSVTATTPYGGVCPP